MKQGDVNPDGDSTGCRKSLSSANDMRLCANQNKKRQLLQMNNRKIRKELRE
jgi:hypothetical protein